MGMIATEAVEKFGEDRNYSSLRWDKKSSEELLPIRWDLRLVRYRDGRLEWLE
jgi:hypothetical protein